MVLGSFDSITLVVYGTRIQVSRSDQKTDRWRQDVDLSSLKAAIEKKRMRPMKKEQDGTTEQNMLIEPATAEENGFQEKKDKVFAVEKKLVDFFSLCSAYKDSRDKIVGALSKLSKIRSQPRPTEQDMVKSQAGKVTDCYSDLINGFNTMFEVRLPLT